MCITLISALLLIGYLNTRNTNSYSGINKIDNSNRPANFSHLKSNQFPESTIIADATTSTAPVSKIISDNNTSFQNNESVNNSTFTKLSPVAQASPSNQRSSNLVKETPLSVINISGNNDLLTIKQDNQKGNSELVLNNTESSPEVDINIEPQKDLKTISAADLKEVKIDSQPLTKDIESMESKRADNAFAIDFNSYISTQEFTNQKAAGNKATILIEEVQSQVEKLKSAANKNDIVTAEDKNWIDNYALYNRPAPKKWANKLDWQIYATPSVVYRTLYNSTAFGSTLNATPFAISSSSQNINSSVNQTPSLGFELGTGLQYLILKNIKIKGGFQLNFTRYNAHAFGNSHPVATKLTMHNFETKTSYEVYRSTAYSNNSGLESVKLHNETFQVSLPVGIDLKLIGNERLQWNVGATIQPTFVAGGKSFLISSDRHNYVKETSMLNRWNLNAGFETFVSFRSNGLTWQIGPQFRKQLFSTNSKTFAVEEKLVNYGVKFGVSKTLK